MIALALHLHQMTVDHHISEFLNKGKSKPENGGSDSNLSAEKTALLISKLTDDLYRYDLDFIEFVAKSWNIVFSVPVMNNWRKL
ncbi:TPA: hypothetical protein L9M21_001151 [Klebsiella quasipneumoniae subsp. quasipneumoniae]|nr:hypothetical protein [Escherichia coli]HBR1692583.1 hypothetical protein [Klebsiella quasipneumoniae subsp. quasipneumoniae]HCB1581687.1 hypothetical protein [Citrobacter braakii]HDD8588697.1 hypothetical protein [Escherichia coli]HDW2027571.1 hypothetical protein [Enterobacter ludwigii]